MRNDFNLLMLSAMYENGGNTTQRFLDGHPRLHVYPFESQLGTRLVTDSLSSIFPVKYRWPVFDLEATLDQDYQAIIDEECKVRARTPHVSKFRHVALIFPTKSAGSTTSAISKLPDAREAFNVEAFFRRHL